MSFYFYLRRLYLKFLTVTATAAASGPALPIAELMNTLRPRDFALL
jgi:hypothetical protein